MRETLLSERKLSLIVDLDQTIIHTTVDPTVGEWMAEIREESAGATEQSGREASAVGKEHGPEGSPAKEATGPQDETTTPPSTPPLKAGELPDGVKPAKEPNPNAEALRDVARFQLEDDLPPGTNPRLRMKAAGRWYYTKPRYVLLTA
jgi:RNA polymerase II subunit A-like phosphatase